MFLSFHSKPLTLNTMYNYHLTSANSYLQTNSLDMAIMCLKTEPVHTARYLLNGMFQSKCFNSREDRLDFIDDLETIKQYGNLGDTAAPDMHDLNGIFDDACNHDEKIASINLYCFLYNMALVSCFLTNMVRNKVELMRGAIPDELRARLCGFVSYAFNRFIGIEYFPMWIDTSIQDTEPLIIKWY